MCGMVGMKGCRCALAMCVNRPGVTVHEITSSRLQVMKASKAAADRDVMNEVKDSYEQALAEDRRREAQHHQSKVCSADRHPSHAAACSRHTEQQRERERSVSTAL